METFISQAVTKVYDLQVATSHFMRRKGSGVVSESHKLLFAAPWKPTHPSVL